VTLDLEDRLWEQLEAAADREAARGRVARGAASTRAALPKWKLRAAAPLAAGAAVVVLLLVALAPDRPRPQWRADRFAVTGADLGAAVAGHGALWSYDRHSGQLLRLDPRTHRVVARVVLPVPSGDVSLASGAGAVWAVPSAAIRHSAPAPAHPPPGELVRIDPRTDRVAARVSLRAPDGSPLLPVDVVALPGAVWVWGDGGDRPPRGAGPRLRGDRGAGLVLHRPRPARDLRRTDR
jgi:hypothetical protein